MVSLPKPNQNGESSLVKTFVPQTLLVAVSAAVFSLAASATPVFPGGPTVAASNNISVTNDGTLAQFTGTVQSSTASAVYTEMVIMDATNIYAMDDLTFVFTIKNTGNGVITATSLSDGFDSLPNVNVGYIAGGGEYGVATPTRIGEDADGVVNFLFPDTAAISAGNGTEYLVIQTAFTSLPTGTANNGLGTVDVTGPAAVTPEPGSLFLLGTGLLGSFGVLKRRRDVASL